MRGVESNESDFLPPDVAFRVAANVEGNVIRVRWVIADGYYLYRSKIEIKPESPDLAIAAPVLPNGVLKSDPYLGSQEIYRQQVEATAGFSRIDGGAHPLQVKVIYQGCADAGLCYPPITKVLFPATSAARRPRCRSTSPRVPGNASPSWVEALPSSWRDCYCARDASSNYLRHEQPAAAPGGHRIAGCSRHLGWSTGLFFPRAPLGAAGVRAAGPSQRQSQRFGPRLEAGPEVAGALPARKIPDRLPEFSLQDPSGKATPIGSFGDKSLIINFWATWCAPCRSEIPLLETLHAEWADRAVSVVGIAVDHREAVLEFAKRFKIGYPLLIGEQDALDAAAALGVESPVFPFTVFTDRRGEVVALFVGELHKPQAELILSQVQSLNQGQIELAAARHAIAAGLEQLAPKPAG